MGRNSPCPCGSARRYKQCCGAVVAEQPASFAAIMAQALDAQRDRRLPQAEALYRKALQLQPGHPDAMHMLGVALYSQGRHQAAVQLIRQAGELTQWSMPGVLHNHRLAVGALLLGRDGDISDRLRLEYRQWLAEREATAARQDPQPLVSVVLCARGHGDDLAQALASVYAQTWQRLELIVVTDGFRNRWSGTIEHLLRDCPFPHRLLMPADEGASGSEFVALEQAIALARGSWINPLGCADRFDPTRIATMVDRVARRGFEWGFAACEASDATTAASSNHAAAERLRQQIAETCDRVASADTAGAALLGDTDPVVTPGNLFFSRALYERLGGIDEYASNPLRDFSLRALWLAEPCFVPTALNHWQIDPDRLDASAGERHYVEVQELLGAYFRRALSESPPNRFAPARSSNGWQALAVLLASGQCNFVTPDLLCRIGDECAQQDRSAALRPATTPRDGLNLVGYFRGEFGLGESVRTMAASCIEGAIAASCHDTSSGLGARSGNRSMDGRLAGTMAYRNTLIHLNPDEMAPVWWRLHERGELRDRRVIGCWYWELDTFPARWRPALERVDEIWVASAFVAQTVGRATDKPVIRIPHAIDVRLAQPARRADFGLRRRAANVAGVWRRRRRPLHPPSISRPDRSLRHPGDPARGASIAAAPASA